MSFKLKFVRVDISNLNVKYICEAFYHVKLDKNYIKIKISAVWICLLGDSNTVES